MTTPAGRRSCSRLGSAPARVRRSWSSAQTWLCSWANESLPPTALGDMERVRQFGEENDYPVLPGQASSTIPNSSLRLGWSRPPCSTPRGCGRSRWTTRNCTS
ncbi:DUF6882 domain-containing protein [Streptomyces sp. NPDC057621]|uniref:DUF6882 domain-containing protein n=1 Tax=Streptomyces sp. NPDC057621 TaxID=3346186 RepID=UPI0036BC1AFA